MNFYTFGIISLAGLAMAHMELYKPAPRLSPYHPGYKLGEYDYNIKSPLGPEYPYPCRGAKPGPIYNSYQAGSSIDVNINGTAIHNGGHCQFSFSYDQTNFAVVKTVMGNCLTGGLNYQVPIPVDAPNGNVTFAWTWINRSGNREFYMNCIDLEIKGGKASGGVIVGKKALVANLPGYPGFPEGFSDTYGQALYDNQPLLTVTPTNSPTTTSTTTPTTTSITTTSTSTTTSTKPTSTTTTITSTNTTSNPQPTGCLDGGFYCQSITVIAICSNQQLYPMQCPDGTTCKGASGFAQCSF